MFVTENFYIDLFSDLHKLTVLYNIVVTFNVKWEKYQR